MTKPDDVATLRREIAERDWGIRVGDHIRPGAGESTVVHNPADGSVLTHVNVATAADVSEAITTASEGAKSWGRMTPRERAIRVRQFADVLEKHAEELAWLDTFDVGVPLWMMRLDVATGIERMRMFADLAMSLAGQTIPASQSHLHLTVPEPFGVVARIIPFNHPFMFAASKSAAPLVAGNSVVLKPSELTPLSALRMGELADGIFPPGVLAVLHGGPDVGDALVRHHSVSRIAFTGSHQVGRAIQASAADAGIKHVTLELGGKNALLLFPDADLDLAVKSAVKGMNFAFSGQSCGSTSRVLVQESRFEEFTERYVEAVGAIRQGLPWEAGVQMGPMISGKQQTRALGFIERASSAGCRVLTGGGVPDWSSDGYFVEPTVLADVDPAHEVATEEVFGPVAALMPFTDEEHALQLANAVDYGLTGSVWTRDLDRAIRVSRRLEVGYVWVNDTSTHFPGVPFGGYKLSGIGREESAEELHSYVQTKAINVVATT